MRTWEILQCRTQVPSSLGLFLRFNGKIFGCSGTLSFDQTALYIYNSIICQSRYIESIFYFVIAAKLFLLQIYQSFHRQQRHIYFFKQLLNLLIFTAVSFQKLSPSLEFNINQMWKGFDQAAGWQQVSTKYGSNNTSVHILQMYIQMDGTLLKGNIYAFKNITIRPMSTNQHISSSYIDLKRKDIRQVKNEIYALQKLKCYHTIVQLLQVLVEDQDQDSQMFFSHFLKKQSKRERNICLIMEYCEMGTLKQYICQNVLKQRQIILFLMQLVECLQNLRQSQIIHRDLRTTNIMLTIQGLKIIDFDNSYAKGQSEVENLSFCFVEDLAAPELITLINLPFAQKMKFSVDQLYYLQQKSDLYSLGTILFEMMARKQFKRQEYMQLIQCQDYSSPLYELMEGLLIQDKNKRFALEYASDIIVNHFIALNNCIFV